MSADNVLAAIKNRFGSDGGLKLVLPGGLYVNEVPEANVTLPYAVVTQTVTALAFTTETTLSLEEASIEFMAYAVGAAAAQRCLTELRRVFDWCTLSFTAASGLTTTHMRPRSWGLTNEMVRHRNGQLIFRSDLSYDSLTSKSIA